MAVSKVADDTAAQAALADLRATGTELAELYRQAEQLLERLAATAARFNDETVQVIDSTRVLAAATLAAAPLTPTPADPPRSLWDTPPSPRPAHYYGGE